MRKIFKNRTLPASIEYKKPSPTDANFLSPYHYTPTVDLSTAAGLYEYEINGARVKATSEDVEYENFVFTIPDNTILDSCSVTGVLADLTDNAIEITFNFENTDLNIDILNYNPPTIELINTTLANINNDTPSDVYTLIYETSPQKKITLISDGTIIIRIEGLGGMSNWTIKIIF